MNYSDHIILLVTCPDQRGIVAKYTGLLFNNNVNVLTMEEHVEEQVKMFFMRLVLDISKMSISASELIISLNKLGDEFSAEFQLYNKNEKVNTAVFVTKERLPLYDLLIRTEIGQLNCNMKMVISNHEILKNAAEQYNVPFHYFPVTRETKVIHEPAILKVLENEKIDLIVLARYMQILSPAFLSKYEQKIINIHHGFLPAFKGSKPYHQAWKRGVKIIGATAHYVTNDLDEGPIICQDVTAINHTNTTKEMIEAGQDIERRVLTNSVKAHLERRVLIYQGRTIVFRG